MTDPTCDVLGLGCTAIDDLLYVETYPAADAKVRVRRRRRECGGLTATALVAAARLGSRCVFAGVLGEDELSQFVLQRFAAEGIDLRFVCRRPEARPIHSTIVVEETGGARTVFFDLEGAFGAADDWPDASLVRGAGVLFVDHFGMDGMIRAARIARDAGVPVVADLEADQHPRFAELLGLIDHLILSRDFAGGLTGASDPAGAAAKLWNADRQAVVVTCGSEGCWWAAAESAGQPVHQPAYRVEVVDTTGCGDVFHGAYASALARRLPLPERLRFAAAAAALKATQPGGQAGIPDRETVEGFLQHPSR